MDNNMATHYKKIYIVTLFFGCILLPMDPPTKETAPISIITLLDIHIEYFSNKIAALDDKITRAQSRENLRRQLEGEKSELQELLELNQSFKQQWQDNLNERLQNHQQLLNKEARSQEEFRKTVDRFNTEMPKIIPSHFQPIDNTTQFTYSEVTPFPPKNVDKLVQNTENNMMRRIDGILEEQGNKLVTEMAKVSDSYQQDIEILNKQIDVTTEELKKQKNN